MPTYTAHSQTWLAHENRMVHPGETFTTDFPEVNGKPMRLADNIELVKKKPGGKADEADKADE